MAGRSHHAARRQAQRGITDDHLDLARDYGTMVRQGGGRRAYHLGRRGADRARRAGVPVPDRAIGVAAVEASDGTLVTAVRSGDRRRLRRSGRRRRHGGSKGPRGGKR